MKKAAFLIVLLLLFAYMIVWSYVVPDAPATEMCQGVLVNVSDSLDYDVLSEEDLLDYLGRQGYSIKELPAAMPDPLKVEQSLLRHPLIKRAQCFVTSGDYLRIKVHTRTPMFRVMGSDGNYYIDADGGVINRGQLVINLPVVTGNLDKDFAVGPVMELVRVINESEFWSSQIEQINVTKLREIELVPRVGSHLLLLGEATDFQNKLDRLFNFYTKALNTVGWEKYSTISVAFAGQVVCNRR